IRLSGHAVGGIIVLLYAGLYAERVHKAVSSEGIGFPEGHRIHGAASEQLRRWIERVREVEKRQPRSYPSLDAAVARMKEANPHLSDEVARHLTRHGTNWDANGCMMWKFDNYVRAFSPYGNSIAEAVEIFGRITSPSL